MACRGSSSSAKRSTPKSNQPVTGGADGLIEGVRQPRAALSVYRFVVDRLTECLKLTDATLLEVLLAGFAATPRSKDPANHPAARPSAA
jgi:hypothetical protein